MIRSIPLWASVPVGVFLVGLAILLPNKDWLLPLRMLGLLLNLPGAIVNMLWIDFYNHDGKLVLLCNLPFSITAGFLVHILVKAYLANKKNYTKGQSKAQASSLSRQGSVGE